MMKIYFYSQSVLSPEPQNKARLAARYNFPRRDWLGNNLSDNQSVFELREAAITGGKLSLLRDISCWSHTPIKTSTPVQPPPCLLDLTSLISQLAGWSEIISLLDWIILSLVIPDNSLAIKPNDAVNIQFYK